jgi:cation/acetate symporter
MYGGLISSLVLIIGSPVVSGAATSMFPSANFQWFGLNNPGIISVPLSFFLGWLGSVTEKEHNAAKYAEMEVRSLTGAGAEKAISH